jgi:hypothetical protein
LRRVLALRVRTWQTFPTVGLWPPFCSSSDALGDPGWRIGICPVSALVRSFQICERDWDYSLAMRRR